MTKELIKKSKDAVKGNWWRIIGTTLVAAVIAGIIGGVIGALVKFIMGTCGVNNADIIKETASCLASLVSLFVTMGLITYLINVFHGEGKLKDIFFGFKNPSVPLKAIASAILVIVWVIAVLIVSVLLLLIPYAGIVLYIAGLVFMIYGAIRMSFFQYAIIKGEGIKSSIKKSCAITKGHVWTYIWSEIKIALWPIILILLGLIPLGIGIGMGAASLAGDLDLTAGKLAIGALALIVIGAIIELVAGVWIIILSPALSMLPIAYYEKFDDTEEVVFTEIKEENEIENKTENEIQAQTENENENENDGPVVK